MEGISGMMTTFLPLRMFRIPSGDDLVDSA